MTLVGHDNAWRAWREAMTSARMHHAWILAGTKGVGKGLFARAAAAELVVERMELFAEELRLAQQALSGITGEFSADDLLGEIFGRFCIGK